MPKNRISLKVDVDFNYSSEDVTTHKELAQEIKDLAIHIQDYLRKLQGDRVNAVTVDKVDLFMDPEEFFQDL